MRKWLQLLVLLAVGLACTGIRSVQARSVTPIQVLGSPVEVAPLPPPTPTGSAKATVIAQLDEPFTLHIKEWATIRDTPEALGVQLAALVNDSRCPARVNCVVAGQVEFMLRLRTGNGVNPQEFPIGTYPVEDGNKVRYGSYVIELNNVEPPAPPPDERLDPSMYEATLVVHRDDDAPPKPTITPTEQDEQEVGQAASVNQPFALHVGETADIAEADLHLTLRSVTDDSGCLTESDCSVMLAEGTLVLQQGDQREVLNFNVSFTPEQPFDYDFAGYTVQLVHIKKARNGEHLATFVVKKPTPQVVIPAPQRVDRCPSFSRFDAAALLQEEVAPKAIANLVFGPLAPAATEVVGSCGYVTTAFSDARQIDERAPLLASEVAADRAVVVVEVQDNDITQLLQLVNLVAAADPDAAYETMLRLQAQLTAGFADSLLSDLTTLAEANEAITVSSVQGLGDEGVWVWQQLDNGYFALLLTRYDRTFRVVIALLHDDAHPGQVLDYATLLVRHLDQEPISTITVPPMATPQAPPEQPVINCDLVTVDAAAAILDEDVHEPVAVAGQEASCLYVPQSEEPLSAEDAATTQPEYGVITERLTGVAAAEQLRGLADELKAANPRADEPQFMLMETMLRMGDLAGTLALLPQLAVGADHWTIEALPTLDKSLLWLWFTDEDHTYSALLGADDDGAMTAIIASLPPNRDATEVRAAFIDMVSDWLE